MPPDGPYQEFLELIDERAVIDLYPHGAVPLIDCLDRPALVLPEHDLIDIPVKMALAELAIDTQLRPLQQGRDAFDRVRVNVSANVPLLAVRDRFVRLEVLGRLADRLVVVEHDVGVR